MHLWEKVDINWEGVYAIIVPYITITTNIIRCAHSVVLLLGYSICNYCDIQLSHFYYEILSQKSKFQLDTQ